MLKWIAGILTNGPYYIRINRGRIAVRNVSSGNYFECGTVVGVDGSDRVVSVGLPVSPDAVSKSNPFDHPRLLVSDFALADKAFSYVVKMAARDSYFQPSPIIVVHPDVELEGGLSPVEARVLRELSESAGARKTYIHYGHMLSDDEVKTIASAA
ncbi:MAG: hypothetical protein HKM98_02745 [Gammaproteobacteria bacterium]|nr:hypothetical protein [Gammaproteobacteria bacterium]